MHQHKQEPKATRSSADGTKRERQQDGDDEDERQNQHKNAKTMTESATANSTVGPGANVRPSGRQTLRPFERSNPTSEYNFSALILNANQEVFVVNLVHANIKVMTVTSGGLIVRERVSSCVFQLEAGMDEPRDQPRKGL